MALATTHDLDYLAARLHARRSRMAEAKRLDDLCQQHTLTGLFQSMGFGADISTAISFQRRLLQELMQEFAFCQCHLDGREREFIDWLRFRFSIENLKVLLRGFLNRLTPKAVAPHLIMFDTAPMPEIRALLAASTVEDFSRRLPDPWLRRQMQSVLANIPAGSSGFFMESKLDADYLRCGLKRLRSFPESERKLIAPLVEQRIEAFHLLLVARGRFLHGVNPEPLSVLRAVDTGSASRRFRLLLMAPSLAGLKEFALGHSVDVWPLVSGSGSQEVTDFTRLELLTRNRLWRLANRAFRGGHMGFAAVVAYLELRQLEVANLITLSEGIRLEMAPSRIASHLCGGVRSSHEAIHV